MSCYQPNLITASLDDLTGSLMYHFEGPAKFSDPHEFGIIDDLTSIGKYTFIVPCGRCLGCRIDYSRDWANRMILELRDNPKAIFLTLTYNDQNLPVNKYGYATLCKYDLTKFWKRLRKHFNDARIRYFVAGEYGSRTYRPHYHAIVYGLDLNDFSDLRQCGKNELRQPYFTSPLMESIWSNGYILMSSVSWRTCAYVARYVTKKSYKAEDDYDSFIEPEFSLSSRKPGLGMLHASEMLHSGNTVFPVDGRDGIHDVFLPKSIIRALKTRGDDLDTITELCYNRSKDASSRLISNLDAFDIDYKTFLEKKEAAHLKRIKLLKERK